MKQSIETAKTHIVTHQRNYLLGAIGFILVAVLVALFIYNNPQKIVYKPQNACELFTPAKAQDLLGDHVINVNTDKVTIEGNIGTSKCSYTDSNPNQNQMKVAAIAIRSGINDGGIAENKAGFRGAKAQSGMQPVSGIGNDAFFNPNRGQLNILSDRLWILVSYGVGATPQSNSQADNLALAHKILSN